MKGHGKKPENHGAILVVAMGTTQKEGRAVIDNLMELIRKDYPKAEVEVAFNYEAVRLVLRENGEEVSGPLAAMTRLLDKGHTQVVVQPLYLTPGGEFHNLYSIITSINDLAGTHGAIGFEGVLISGPLLMNPEDYFEVAEVISRIYGDSLAEEEALLLVAPTSEGDGDPSLCQMQMVMDDICPAGNIVIGAVGGYPGIGKAIARLRHIGIKKIRLVPFTVVPGIHTWIEISGEANPDSWQKVLESEGYTVSIDDRGLGEYEAIQKIFCRKLGETALSHGFLK